MHAYICICTRKHDDEMMHLAGYTTRRSPYMHGSPKWLNYQQPVVAGPAKKIVRVNLTWPWADWNWPDNSLFFSSSKKHKVISDGARTSTLLLGELAPPLAIWINRSFEFTAWLSISNTMPSCVCVWQCDYFIAVHAWVHTYSSHKRTYVRGMRACTSLFFFERNRRGKKRRRHHCCQILCMRAFFFLTIRQELYYFH